MSSMASTIISRISIVIVVTLPCFLPALNAAGFIPAWTWIDKGYENNALSDLNWPGGRSGSATWKDKMGNIWLFGGFGYGNENIGVPTLLNDFWKYDSVKKRWSIVQPEPGTAVPPGRQLSSICGVTGNMVIVFGGLGVDDFALYDTWIFYIDKSTWIPLKHEGDLPSSRGEAAMWCTYDHMYVFGGIHRSSTIRSDLWSLSLRDLSWVNRSSLVNGDSEMSLPIGRNGAMTWLGKDIDKLYMFGGNVLNNLRNLSRSFGYTSDMWMYSISSNKWSLLFGSVDPGKPGLYSSRTRMIGNGDNFYTPGCRRAGATWTDNEGYLYLFGGEGTDEQTPKLYQSSLLLSDIWRFDPIVPNNTHPWIWMGGSKTAAEELRFGNRLIAGNKNTPGARCESATWTIGENFYLLGGQARTSIGDTFYRNGLWSLSFAPWRLEVSWWVPLLIIFFGLCLVGILVGVSIYIRKTRHFRGHTNTRYSPLSDSAAFES